MRKRKCKRRRPWKGWVSEEPQTPETSECAAFFVVAWQARAAAAAAEVASHCHASPWLLNSKAAAPCMFRFSQSSHHLFWSVRVSWGVGFALLWRALLTVTQGTFRVAGFMAFQIFPPTCVHNPWWGWKVLGISGLILPKTLATLCWQQTTGKPIF